MFVVWLVYAPLSATPSNLQITFLFTSDERIDWPRLLYFIPEYRLIFLLKVN